MNIPRTILHTIQQPWSSSIGLSSLTGVVTGMAQRVTNAIPPHRILETICNAPCDLPSSVTTILASPLKYTTGLMVLVGKILWDTFRPFTSEGKQTATARAITALLFGMLPTALQATSIMPSWLTSDLARQSLYGASLAFAAEAIGHATHNYCAKAIKTLATVTFGLMNLAFFAHQTRECQGVQTTWQQFFGTILATGIGTLANHYLTPLLLNRVFPAKKDNGDRASSSNSSPSPSAELCFLNAYADLVDLIDPPQEDENASGEPPTTEQLLNDAQKALTDWKRVEAQSSTPHPKDNRALYYTTLNQKPSAT